MCYGVSYQRLHHGGKEEGMKVWLYYRLSRDEDEELNSLTNQRKIIYEYAVSSVSHVPGLR